ncbi:hypothetical protein EYR40_001972 [Pleurotus pulmonarius]|nr:hypothetical protein EYR36_011634 [Pleurotus pulmonarius]KAF4585135.1 hypothetical protein EYR40_001972 [Pleurotus pulmonarius]KAF4607462.1 hypothetical protein EYR38_001534 [Pleurotus pulmonarius]
MAIGNPSSTTAVLKYYVPPADGARAYQHINTDPTTGERPRNFTYQDKDVVVENIRGKESSVSLDTTGFQYVRRPAKHGSFRNDEEIQNEYYPESIELIKELTGASKVVIFDHTVRRRRPEDKEDTPQKRQPVAQVHVDQTNKSSVARVHRHLPPSEAPKLLQKRFQIINLWRPISHVASDWPLALCDYRSVDPKADMVPTALVYPDREGETFGVKYNPSHQWKYVRDMAPDECVLIKCFDSVQDGSVAVFTPHTGFQDPATPPDAPLRESIELRALVFYD